jgi:pyruvate kinase
LSLLWGVKTFYYDNFNSTDKTVEEINEIAFKKGFVEKEDFVINLAAMPIRSRGMVNTLRVSTI